MPAAKTLPTVLTFLRASIPLTKKFQQLKDGTLVKHAYPKVKHFTSETVDVSTIDELHKAIADRAVHKAKPCLLKGGLLAPLTDEARAQMSPPDMVTGYVALDFDDAPFSTPAEAMKAIGLEDISYVWQFSASAKIGKKKTLSGHAFLLLEATVHPKSLKAWTMYLNLRTDVLKKHITLNAAKHTLHFPLDSCINDNSRLIYIAEPVFDGMANPIPTAERIQLVTGKHAVLPLARIAQHSIEALNKEKRELVNELRTKEGLPALRSKLKMVGEFEVQTGVGEATTYQVVDDGGEFIRYNLNGGDSQAYWHPRGNFEYLHSFKGEPSMLMKEILPQRFAELTANIRSTQQTPSGKGDLLLAFREKRTAEYWKGIWNPRDVVLDIWPVKSKDMLEDFMQSHGTTVGPYVPEWQIIFDPQNEVIVDETDHIINRFIVPPMMRQGAAKAGLYPTIQAVIDSAVGTGPVQEHFLNWLAVIFQYRIKTQTSWILHGTYGTGKGILLNCILQPIMGKLYCDQIKASVLQHSFDGWKENKLIMMIDEIEADLFEKSGMEGDLRNLITEPYVDIHRKNVNIYSVKSYINLIFTSNKPQPVRIPMGDRRFNVGQYQTTRYMPTAEEIEKLIPAELEAFAHYLMTRKADISLSRQVIQTADREAIQALGVTSVDEFAHDIVTGNLVKLWEHMPDEAAMNEHGLVDPTASAYASLLKRFVTEQESRISRDELRLLFLHAIGKVPEGANKFTAWLRHHGVMTRRMRSAYENDLVYGVEVVWNISDRQRRDLTASVGISDKKIRRVK